MSDQPAAALHYARQNHERFLTELKEFTRIPSVSTDPDARADMQRAAQWVAEQLHRLEMQKVSVYPTSGQPVVYGEWMSAGPGKPIILIYGHYDVQPAEPLELWDSPAFEPTQRGENLFARGASDMKGQVMATLKAVEALQRTGGLEVNIKYLVEGEEEIGSPSLDDFILANKNLLACDFAVNPDAGMIDMDVPTITFGLRGLSYFELNVFGPDHDLHSGQYGGVVHNPAQVLCELVAGMHDEMGRVALLGFYDQVLPLDEQERVELANLPMDENHFLERTGAPVLYGEAGYTPIERGVARPTLEINGLLAGFTGKGSKTVLPAKAMAKISMRLVPNQDPEQVYQQLLQYLQARVPPTVRWEVSKMAGGPASITDRQMPAVAALHQALEATWGKAPVYRREGGSVPVVALMQSILGVDSVLTGFGLPDDNLHAPNEKIHLPTYYRGIDAFIRFLSLLGQEA